ncbi:hypothetical protein [Croceicoccus mobilis]|uniref:hypothetical protein n=1 Tax=Croceicoccus mobilis TaxID=1703339 RepID=UPI0012E95AE5|nr:hypothetical protein [Croceicoccus mobilis]
METPAFFESKTGIPLCDRATVENVRIGEHDYETDFTYGVRLTLPGDCKARFFDALNKRLGGGCTPTSRCNFMDDNSWSYEIGKMQDRQLKFVLRAT